MKAGREHDIRIHLQEILNTIEVASKRNLKESIMERIKNISMDRIINIIKKEKE